MKPQQLTLTSAVVLFVCLMIPHRAFAQDTSTPEERERWVEITHKLEINPLDESVRKDGEWALKRLIEVHDIHIPLCASIFEELKTSKYKYGPEITRQFMLGSAAFMIENPGSANNIQAMNVAALESLFKAYNAILQQKPDAKAKSLDELIKKRGEGKLDDYVKEKCGPH